MRGVHERSNTSDDGNHQWKGENLSVTPRIPFDDIFRAGDRPSLW